MRGPWRSVYSPIHNQSSYVSIHPSTFPPTYSPTFAMFFWSGNFSPSQFSSLHVSSNLSIGLLASTPFHLASFVHMAASLVFLHFSFLTCKIKLIFISLDCCKSDNHVFFQQWFLELRLYVSVFMVSPGDTAANKTNQPLPLWSFHTSGRDRL